jgi:hypothetical protein
MFIRTIFIIITIQFSATMFAQQATVLKGDGLNKLSVLIGQWKAENQPGSKDNTSAVFACRLSENKNFLVCDQVINHEGHQTNNLSIYSYDSSDHYKLTLVGIPGMEPFSIPAVISGDSLIYPGSHMENGIKVYNRTLNVFLNNSKYEFFIQSSNDNIHWTTSLSGTAAKIK